MGSFTKSSLWIISVLLIVARIDRRNVWIFRLVFQIFTTAIGKKSHSSTRKLFYAHTDLKLDTDIHGEKIKNWYCFKMTSKVSYFQQWTFNNHFRIVHYKMHLWIPSYTYVKMAVLFVVIPSSLTNFSDISDVFAACTRTLWWWRQQATLKRWYL